MNLIRLKQIESSGGDKNYIHDQFNTSDTWTIEHPLNKLCSVQAYDSNENRIYGNVTYQDLNKIIIHFSVSVSGIAICN